ncbi:hypothetical protein GBA63_02225 [Rubrobacter tropicus]|uniref:Uncharacterized protein n=1 Tax=Rubrobacter tropicus TaxID=2653851 RepID=A0A6G8Q505_9ACTN|nr:hypothetical protein [Rubrobacter tropicus]QIN81574.1 hypothetical protein GBA63_02225 [Rubrobacter tropicus]
MKLRIQLYRLDRCGFYRRGRQDADFGSIQEWYMDFLGWLEPKRLAGVPLPHTSTLAEERNDVPLDIYCVGVTEDGRGNFGVSLFSRSLGEEEGGTVMAPDASLGNPTFLSNELRPGAIPGWLSYFWVVPAENIVVALMPARAVASIDSFREYFLGYLRSESEYLDEMYQKVDVATGTSKPVYRYKNRRGEYAHGVFPSLQVSQEVSNAGQINSIKNSWREIRSFIMRTETLYLAEEDKGEGVVNKLLDSSLFKPKEETQSNQSPP